VPALPETRHLVNAERIALMKKGVRIVNTARGELIDDAALAAAIASGHVAGAGLDVFDTEPPTDTTLTKLPQVVATPHIAASTLEGQELVGNETALQVRDYLKDGVIRNAVNFPSVPPDDVPKLRPYLDLAERLGALVQQLVTDRPEEISIHYYGPIVTSYENVIGSAVLSGALARSFDSVTPVNARAIADERGLHVVESHSTRSRNYGNVISVGLRGAQGERSVEGTVVEPEQPRLCGLDGVPVEASLSGTLVVMDNEDRPGVVGGVGIALARQAVNIASFALGRGEAGAVAVIRVDENPNLEKAFEEIRKVVGVKELRAVRLP
jgi:D-3-phosphoglycerate dehydrogenase